MKKIILSVLTVALFATTNAQQKIGHLNSAEILAAMPEYKQMQESVEKKKGEYAKVMETMYTEYQKKSKEVEEKGSTMTQIVLDNNIQAIKDLERRISEFEQKAQGELSTYAETLMKPLNDKYLKGVKDIAKDQGYTYILDVAQGGVVYFPEGTNDLTQAVKTKIGATLTPPAPQTNPVSPK